MKMTSKCSKRKDLGDFPDLYQLISSSGEHHILATRITRLPSPVQDRASFCLEFEGGTLVKGIQLHDAGRVERYVDFAIFLESERVLPNLLASRGRGILLEWIQGTAVNQLNASPELLTAAGSLQARFHGLPVSRHMADRYTRTENWTKRLEVKLRLISDTGALHWREAEKLLHLALRHMPSSFDTGIIHQDFCAENLVVTESGSLHPVDNETFAIDACDYDLARTWHRWPLGPRARTHYLKGYARHRSTTTFENHFPFWIIGAVATAAAARIRTLKKGWRIPVSRLQQILRAAHDGRLPSPLSYDSMFTGD